MNDIINRIIRLDLCPLQQTKQGNDHFEPLFRQAGTVEPEFTPAYDINFNAPLFSSKVKYYKRLIDNDITATLNHLFASIELRDDLIAFKRKKLNEQIDTFLVEIKKVITEQQLDIAAVLTISDYSLSTHTNELTYIYHYLILALIRCYMEFQQYYIEHVEPDKRQTIDYFFVQTLQWRMPQNVGIVPIPKIEIQPIEEKAEPKAKSGCVLSFTYTKLNSDSDNINTLFSELKRHGAIPADFPITEFKHLFSGVEVAKPIPWIGNKSDLAYLFKLLTNKKKVLELPADCTLWDVVDYCFVDKDGNHFGGDTLRKQQTPKKTIKDIEHFAYLMT